jgi:hypothetical protein
MLAFERRRRTGSGAHAVLIARLRVKIVIWASAPLTPRPALAAEAGWSQSERLRPQLLPGWDRVRRWGVGERPFVLGSGDSGQVRGQERGLVLPGQFVDVAEVHD